MSSAAAITDPVTIWRTASLRVPPLSVVGVEDLLLLRLVQCGHLHHDRAGGLGDGLRGGRLDGARLVDRALERGQRRLVVVARSMLCRASTRVIAMSPPPASRNTAENVRVSRVRSVRRARCTVTPGTPRPRRCRRSGGGPSLRRSRPPLQHDVAERVEILVPDAVEQFLGADHGATGEQQRLENAELLTGEQHRRARLG